MIGAKSRYMELRWDLLFERAWAGGSLAMQREAEYAEELDRCWNEMTLNEQEEVETAIATESAPDAPAELSFIDAPLDIGGSDQPRRAA